MAIVVLLWLQYDIMKNRNLKIVYNTFNENCEGFMNIKNRPNHKIYLQVLRQMSPEKRLLKAFELSEFARQLFIHGLHERFPNLQDEEFQKILLKRLDKCHNRNY